MRFDFSSEITRFEIPSTYLFLEVLLRFRQQSIFASSLQYLTIGHVLVCFCKLCWSSHRRACLRVSCEM